MVECGVAPHPNPLTPAPFFASPHFALLRLAVSSNPGLSKNDVAVSTAVVACVATSLVGFVTNKVSSPVRVLLLSEQCTVTRLRQGHCTVRMH